MCNEKFNLNIDAYNKHMVIFGLKEIRECGEEDEKQKLMSQTQPKNALTHFNLNPIAIKILVMHSKPHV